MHGRKLLRIVLILSLFFSTVTKAERDSSNLPSVVFLNPGERVERGKGLFWPMTARLMEVAAKRLGMQLEVLYAERDHLEMLRQAKSVAKRKKMPDYVIMVNEKQAATQMLQMFAETSAKVLLIHNDLTVEQRLEVGIERERIQNWIGTVTTNEAKGTARMMDALYRQLGNIEPQVISITGARSTPVSLQRAQGVNDYITQTGRGEQLQLVFSDWGVKDAQIKAEILLNRYPQTNIIWAANYAMALGALLAVKDSGSNVLVGSTASAPQRVQATDSRGMTVSLGSHFFIGAWAMVLLHDYHHGEDFAAHGGVRQNLDHLSVINSANSPLYYQVVYDQTDEIDFSIFSKFLHPSPGDYTFGLKPLMDLK